MRVAIVNDMAMALETLRRVVQSRADLSVAWTATDGASAVERCKRDTPDLILMDMIMPGVDGVEATRRIMRECPCAILVVTATVDGNAGKVYEALGSGALDAVQTPAMGVSGNLRGAEELLKKIEHVRLLQRLKASATPSPRQATPASALPPAGVARTGGSSFIAIGASTGGPQAVAECIGSIPASIDRPILVVQHIGEEFVAGFADWLARGTRRPVKLVDGHTTPEPRVIYVAAKAKHLFAYSNGDIGLEDEPRDHLHKPSVDVLFDSLATSGASGVAALLTGMGRDGAQGLLALRNAGWWTIAQDEATSVVWGMPGEATRIGAACETLAIGAIGPAIATGFARQSVRGSVPRGGSR